MSLKNCKDCGKSVSDKSKFCVQCGRPNPTVEEKKPFSFLSRLEDIYKLLKSFKGFFGWLFCVCTLYFMVQGWKEDNNIIYQSFLWSGFLSSGIFFSIFIIEEYLGKFIRKTQDIYFFFIILFVIFSISSLLLFNKIMDWFQK